LVTRVACTSQARVVRCPSAIKQFPASNAARSLAADRGLDRVDPLQYPQLPGLFLIGQAGRVLTGQ
jgi:hypothetical protein